MTLFRKRLKFTPNRCFAVMQPTVVVVLSRLDGTVLPVKNLLIIKCSSFRLKGRLIVRLRKFVRERGIRVRLKIPLLLLDNMQSSVLSLNVPLKSQRPRVTPPGRPRVKTFLYVFSPVFKQFRQ